MPQLPAADASPSRENSADGGTEYTLKFVLVGDPSVGKSNLVLRFAKGQYHKDSLATIGMEFVTKSVNFRENCRIKAQIWDTAGQERFDSLTQAYYRGAVGAMLVYDVTNRKTFLALQHWLDELKRFAHENIVMSLVGNKSDLGPERRQVSTLEAAQFAESRNLDFSETSALDASNVTNSFRRLIFSVARLIPEERGVFSGGPAVADEDLPEGWVKLKSRSRPGQFSYENVWTGERIAYRPTTIAPQCNLVNNRHAASVDSIDLTVTREYLRRDERHRKQDVYVVCGSGCQIC